MELRRLHPDPATVMDYVYRSPSLAAIPG